MTERERERRYNTQKERKTSEIIRRVCVCVCVYGAVGCNGTVVSSSSSRDGLAAKRLAGLTSERDITL